VKRLRALDVALLAVLGPLWLLCIGVHVRRVAQGGVAWIPVYVAPGRGGEAPTLTGFWTDAAPPATALAPGDRLLRVGESDLAGAGRIDFLADAYAAAAAAPAPSVLAERAGRLFEAPLPVRPARFPWRTVPVAIGFGATGLLALWRGGGRRAARSYGLGALAYSFHWSILFGASPLATRVGVATFLGGASLFMPLLLHGAILIPERRALSGALARFGPWLFSLFGLAVASAVLGTPRPGALGMRLSLAINLAFLAALAAIVVRNFRRADAAGRRQLKWVLFGVVAGGLPALVTAGVGTLRPDLWWSYEFALVAIALIPVCIAIAILRYRFLDIDRVISATAAYSLLLILLLTLLLTIVPVAARRASGFAGLDVQTAQAALSVLAAGLVVPARRWLLPRVERIFHRERLALEEGLRGLRAELGGVGDVGELLALAGRRLTALLALERCALYARGDASFAPLYAHGAGLPPALPADGALPGLLAEADAPVDAAQWRRWVQRRLLRGVEAAAVESLGASVLLPLRRGGEVDAILALGEKGSGDVFTRGDLALLDALGDRLSLELQRFDEAALRRAEREMQEALGSYVPAAVSEQLARRAPLETGEREVTVLFVDIRGYTSLAEGRQAEEVFRTVNAYTQEVSGIVRAHGGAVVEFHGDGLMAVWGAPVALADKERAALAAGLEMVERVEALEIGGASGEAPRLEIGVGISTGAAFVGDIQAVDRRIWSVIGNTTNLAARLQALSKDLGAVVVIDATTHERGGAELAREFRAWPATEVRGRSEPVDVYALPRMRLAEAA